MDETTGGISEAIATVINPARNNTRLLSIKNPDSCLLRVNTDATRDIRYFESTEFVELDQKGQSFPATLALTEKGKLVFQGQRRLLRAIAEVDFSNFPGAEQTAEGQTGIVYKVPIKEDKVLAVRYLKKRDIVGQSEANTRGEGWEPAIRELERIVDFSKWLVDRGLSQKWGIKFRVVDPLLATQDVLVSEWVEGSCLGNIVKEAPRSEQSEEGVLLVQHLTKAINRFIKIKRFFFGQPFYRHVHQDIALVNILYSKKENGWVVIDPFGIVK